MRKSPRRSVPQRVGPTRVLLRSCRRAWVSGPAFEDSAAANLRQCRERHLKLEDLLEQLETAGLAYRDLLRLRAKVRAAERALKRAQIAGRLRQKKDKARPKTRRSRS